MTGGSALPNAFEELFRDHVGEADHPFSISGDSHPDEPHSVERGALVAARSDEADDATAAAETEEPGE